LLYGISPAENWSLIFQLPRMTDYCSQIRNGWEVEDIWCKKPGILALMLRSVNAKRGKVQPKYVKSSKKMQTMNYFSRVRDEGTCCWRFYSGEHRGHSAKRHMGGTQGKTIVQLTWELNYWLFIYLFSLIFSHVSFGSHCCRSSLWGTYSASIH
jgi:hypothetical protein